MSIRVESERTWKQKAAALHRRNEKLRCLGDGTLNTFGGTGFGHMNGSPIIPPPSFPVDATSGKGVPLTQADWNGVFAVAGVAAKTVDQSWALQDASGNPVATIGTNCTGYGNLQYQQAVTGWDRDAIVIDANVAEGFGLASGTGPNAGSTSVLWFGLIAVGSAAGATRQLLAASNAGTNNCRIQIVVTTGLMRVQCANVNVDGAVNYGSGSVHPFFLKYNRTGSEVKGFTEAEVVTGTYSAAVVDSTKGYPSSTTTVGCRGSFLLGAAFAGAHAEWSDADIKAVMQAMNWTVAW